MCCLLSSAFKFKWLLDNVPSVRDAMDDDRLMFGNVDSWLIWNLTGGVNGADGNHVTDVTNASRTMLMDLNVSFGTPWPVLSFVP